MAKITINNISAGYNSNSQLNTNFDAVEAELNNKVLYRDNPEGEPNQMENNLDMNSNSILNVANIGLTGTITVNGVDYTTSMETIYNNYVSLTQKVTISSSHPSGGNDGDIWFKLI